MVKLFECEVDGATYWVRAADLWDVPAILRAVVLDEQGTTGDVTYLNVEESTEGRAMKQSFRDDETGERRSMWEEFQRASEPGVFACSEY